MATHGGAELDLMVLSGGKRYDLARAPRRGSETVEGHGFGAMAAAWALR
jgi:hypothetical protein